MPTAGTGSIAAAACFEWQGTDESICRVVAAGGLSDGIEARTDGAARVAIHNDRARWQNGCTMQTSETADGAATVAGRWRWRSGVASPAAGADAYRVEWENNAAGIFPILRLRQSGAGRFEAWLHDNAGATRIRLRPDAALPDIFFDAALAAINVNSAGNPLRLDATEFRLRETAAGVRCPVTVPMVNRTGGAVVAGDVVRIDTANDDSVIDTTGAAQTGCLVVVVGGANLATVYCAALAKTQVLCTVAAVNQRDILESSATAKQAQTSAVPVLNRTIGYALTSKGAGATGLVQALVVPSI